MATSQLKFSLSTEQYFHQDVARGRDAASLGTVYNFPKCFGLKGGDWNGLSRVLKEQNTQDPERVRYAVLFLARHGQGYHNVGEEYLGGEIWKRPSTLSPEQPVHQYFPDTRLTPVGQHQANTLSATFRQFLEDNSSTLPWPQAFYVSPLHRALDTSHRTWAPLSSNVGHPPEQKGSRHQRIYKPIVIETLREQMYIQACNQRSKRSEIESFTFNFPAQPSGKNSSPCLFEKHDAHSRMENEEDHYNREECRTFNQVFRFHSWRLPKGAHDSFGNNHGPARSQAFTEVDEIYHHQATNVGRDESNPEVTRRAYKALCTIFDDIYPAFCSSRFASKGGEEGDYEKDKNSSQRLSATQYIHDSDCESNHGYAPSQEIATNKATKSDNSTSSSKRSSSNSDGEITFIEEGHENEKEGEKAKEAESEEETQAKYISITTHAGLMSGIYRVLGLSNDQIPRFPTGIVIPVVIKIEKVNLSDPDPDSDSKPESKLETASQFDHAYGNHHGSEHGNSKKQKIQNDDNNKTDTTHLIPTDRHHHDDNHDYVQGKITKSKDEVLAKQTKNEITGKSLDEVLREIRDQKLYEDLIRRVRVLDKKDTHNHGKEGGSGNSKHVTDKEKKTTTTSNPLLVPHGLVESSESSKDHGSAISAVPPSFVIGRGAAGTGVAVTSIATATASADAHCDGDHGIHETQINSDSDAIGVGAGRELSLIEKCIIRALI